MAPAQREVRIGIMIELNLAPTVDVMAITTLWTIAALVHIIGTMAILTQGRHLVPQGPGMTGVAGEVLVPTF